MHQDPQAQLTHPDADGSPAKGIGDKLRDLALRRVWLPRLLYEALPFIYVLVGAIAIVSTIFNRHWSWIIPHAFLLGCFLIHLGIMVSRARARARGTRK